VTDFDVPRRQLLSQHLAQAFHGMLGGYNTNKHEVKIRLK